MAKVITIAESVAELKQLIAEDRIRDLGETVLSKNGMDWKVIHKDGNGIVIQMCRAYDCRPFARPDKQHPWGWNNYMASQIRRELNDEVITALFGDEQELIEDWQGMGKLFLLSEEEVNEYLTAEDRVYVPVLPGRGRRGAGQPAGAEGRRRGSHILVAALPGPLGRAQRALRPL